MGKLSKTPRIGCGKRILCLTLCLSACLSLAACGSSSNSNRANGGYAYDSIEGVTDTLGISSNSANSATGGLGLFDGFVSSKSESSSSTSGDYKYTEQFDDGNDANNPGYGEEPTKDSDIEINFEKLVYKARYKVETKDYEASVSALRDMVFDLNGFIDNVNYSDSSYYGYGTSSSRGYRTYECTIRIPSDNYQTFIDAVGNLGHIDSSSAWVENISSEYYDNVAYLESYENQMENLQAMYDKATTIDEMMKLESRIAEVNAQILRLKTEIRSMDMDVAYSTISMRINEVIDYSSEKTIEDESTFFSRLVYTFKDSWSDFLDWGEDFLFNFIYIMWYLIIWIIVIIIIVKIWKKNKSKREAKKLAKQLAKEERLKAKRAAKNNTPSEVAQTEKVEQIDSNPDNTEAK